MDSLSRYFPFVKEMVPPLSEEIQITRPFGLNVMRVKVGGSVSEVLNFPSLLCNLNRSCPSPLIFGCPIRQSSPTELPIFKDDFTDFVLSMMSTIESN